MAESYPLHAGPESAFEIVNRFLRDSGYTEQFLLDRFELPNLHFLLYPLGQQGEDFRRNYQGPGLPLLMARLLLGGFAASDAEIGEYVPAPVVEALRALGLLAAAPDGSGRWSCPVILYPALGLYVTADRGFYMEGWPGYRGLDYVMSGTEHICRDYVDSLPDSPCGQVLEIGTGSAFGAMLSARCAVHVWASDLTERAAACAEFNRRLNRIGNMTVVRGDLFAPVDGMRFDRICCNPPFEPPLKKDLVFSVGGEDGEQIMRRVVEDAPRFLTPGGRLYMQVMGTDRLDEAFDGRIRRWLGDFGGECDVAFFIRQTMQPREYAIQQILGENADSWKMEEWNLFYRKLRAIRVLHGHLIVQRRGEPRQVFHTVRRFGQRSAMAQMEWLAGWETRFAQPGFGEWALAARLEAGKDWDLVVRHKLTGGKLAPQSYVLKAEHPFEVETQIRPWIAAMLARCDGTRTGAELLDWVRSNGELAGEEGAAEFQRALGVLGSCEFVHFA